MWETLSPDPGLIPYQTDYKWLTQVYESVKQPSGIGKMLWHALGAMTVERIVADIDDIVNKVRFPDWQHISQGERLERELRRTLLKYKRHTDQDLFDNAYGYIRQYY